jgi:hypothetical protein
LRPAAVYQQPLFAPRGATNHNTEVHNRLIQVPEAAFSAPSTEPLKWPRFSGYY